MRPAQRIKQAEEIARSLKSLLGGSVMSQLLQRTPPRPAAFTAEQEAQLLRCCNAISQLEAALRETTSPRVQLVDALLKQQVACSIGSLVAWVQQQPEQQLSEMRAGTGHQGSAPATVEAGGAAAAIWAAGVHLLERFAVVATRHNSDSAGACSLAANLTQQLDQSGKACSRNCDCTATCCFGRHDKSCMQASLTTSKRASAGICPVNQHVNVCIS
jgi:hypothetical protein